MSVGRWTLIAVRHPRLAQVYLRYRFVKATGKICNMNVKSLHVVRKSDFCLGENKGADQLRSNCEADQRLCFRYTDSTIPLLSKSKISSLSSSSVLVHLGLCWTWPETQIVGFLMHRLIMCHPAILDNYIWFP